MTNIAVHVLQMLDGEKTIDSTEVFKTEADLEEAVKEAINNWDDMQGLHAMFIKEAGANFEPGTVYLSLSVDVNNDFEKWTITSYEN